MLYRASSNPPRLSAVVCDELIKTAQAEMTFSLPPPFRLPAICVSSRPALLPACRVVRRGGMISPVLSACLLGNVIMAMAVPSHPWRPAMCLSARACLYGCGSPLVPLISLPLSSRLPAPLARVGERGGRRREYCCLSYLSHAGGGWRCLLRG